jgi:hypothetical protein
MLLWTKNRLNSSIAVAVTLHLNRSFASIVDEFLYPHDTAMK